MLPIVLTIQVAAVTPCPVAPLALDDRFISAAGTRETVRQVAQVKYGTDVVGFVYRTTDGRLYAQARSGMPAKDQQLIGVGVLPEHHVGDKYRYSRIVRIERNPWRDLVVVFC